MGPDWSEMRELAGQAFLSDTSEPREGWLTEYIHPDDQPRVQAAIASAIAARSVFQLEHRVVRVDGTLGWTSSRAVPLLDASGDIVEWVGTATDITERRHVEAALRESEARHRLLIDTWAQAVWTTDPSGAVVEDSPSWRTYTGQTVEQWLGYGWLDAVHSEDRAYAERGWREAVAARRAVNAEFRLRAPDGGWRWTNVRAVPVLDAMGEIEKWAGINIDIDDLKALQERQRVLLHELQHRVRNTLAIVRSLSKSTAQSSGTIEEFTSHFEGRLDALARTQVVLTRSAGAGVDLETLVREELMAQAPTSERFTVEGPDIILSPKAAEALALAMHELTTNAVKYGALGGSDGRVCVRWGAHEEAGERWLDVDWSETGVRVLASAPRREGFGTELVTLRVPYELRGRGELDLRPEGMRARIAFPLRPGDSALQTSAPGE